MAAQRALLQRHKSKDIENIFLILVSPWRPCSLSNRGRTSSAGSAPIKHPAASALMMKAFPASLLTGILSGMSKLNDIHESRELSA